MNFLQDWPIRRKLMLMAMLASVLALLVACGAFITYEQYSSLQDLERKLTLVARITAANCAAPLEFDDQWEAEQRLRSLAADPRIIYARLSDENGKLYAQYHRGAESIATIDPPPEIPLTAIKVLERVASGGERVGSIFLAYDGLELNTKLSQYLLIMCLVLAASTLAAFFLSTQLQKLISVPLTNLARTLSHVARERDYSLRAPRGGKDEIGSRIKGLNEMLSEIQTRDDELRAARENLERRVETRTQELARSVSLLHATLESTADGILVVDLENRVLAFNTPLLRMWGVERDAVEIGKLNTFSQYAASRTRDPESATQRVKSLLQQPDTEAYDVLELADGRIFERFINPQRVADKCVGCVMNYRDITARRRSEDVLRRTEELYRRAIAGADAVPYAYDYRTRTYLFIGNNIKELLGYTAEEVKPDLWPGITQDYAMRGAALGMTKQEAAERVRSGEIREWRCDMLVKTRDGKLRWISDSSVQNIDEQGNIIGSMGILQDINDRKQAEAELAYERDLLKAMMDNFPDAIYFKDLQSRFVRVSRSKLLEAYRMALGQHERAENGRGGNGNELPWHLSSVENFAEWLPGRSDFDFLPDAWAQEALKEEQEITATGTPLLGKLETLPYPDGTVRWCLTHKLPWRDKAGKIIGTFGASKDITALKEAEAKLEAAHHELLEISRRAGMAEVATSVLHNVGNVLNSVNISAGVVSELMRNSRSGEVGKVAALLEKNRHDMANFLQSPGRIGQLISFCAALSKRLDSERTTVLAEVEELTRNIEHIKEIVAMQQSYSKVAGVEEYQSLSHLVEDALRVQGAGLVRHKVEVERHFEAIPDVLVDKHKVLQILINLISNAKYALTGSDAQQKKVTVSLGMYGGDKVRIAVADNGVGIAPENLTRVFGHGFTTREGGHGFGLHSGALAAREMGGRLTVQSDGLGRGATFTLELPARIRT